MTCLNNIIVKYRYTVCNMLSKFYSTMCFFPSNPYIYPGGIRTNDHQLLRWMRNLGIKPFQLNWKIGSWLKGFSFRSLSLEISKLWHSEESTARRYNTYLQTVWPETVLKNDQKSPISKPNQGCQIGNQKYQPGYILEGFRMENVRIFLEVWNIWQPFGLYYGRLVYFVVIW
jgi:hypothetical protein